MRNKILFLLILLGAMLGGCTQSMEILEGASHACGTVNVQIDGVYSNSQGEIILIKAPADWTPAQVVEFCSLNGG